MKNSNSINYEIYLDDIKITQKSLDITINIAKEIVTPHHLHFHILYDIATKYTDDVQYVEIGCYAGRSACLMLQREKTNVISIDIGKPILKHIACDNIKKFNYLNNSYDYIEGDSRSQSTIDQLKNKLNNRSIDILFIDGSHRYNDVISDFINYENLIKNGGYIIFDDYYDYMHSPEVNKAVNYLITNGDFKNYHIIGTFKNTLQATPKEMIDNNCFIIKKK